MSQLPGHYFFDKIELAQQVIAEGENVTDETANAVLTQLEKGHSFAGGSGGLANRIGFGKTPADLLAPKQVGVRTCISCKKSNCPQAWLATAIERVSSKESN